MTNNSPLRTPTEYERALKEIGVYFANEPEPGTDAADRFQRLAALIKEYEEANFSIPAGSARDDLISRFERGLMLASDKQYIVAMLRSPARAGSSPEMIDDPGYPEAATVCAELYQVIGCLAGELGVFVHPDVQRALDNANEHKLVHRDLLPWPKQPLRPVPTHVRRFRAGLNPERGRPAIEAVPTQAESINRFEKTETGVIDWKKEAERANMLLAEAEAQIEKWREQASQKDIELAVLRGQVSRQR